MPALRPTGRGLSAVKAVERGASPDDFAQPSDALTKCHTCVNAMLVERAGAGDLPLAYCKLMKLRILDVTECSEYAVNPKFKGEPSPSASSAPSSVI